MSSISAIIAEVAAAADIDYQGKDPGAHAALLNSIQRLQLAAEKPTETAKRILYQVRFSFLVDYLCNFADPFVRELSAADKRCPPHCSGAGSD